MAGEPDAATLIMLEVAKAYNLTGMYPVRHPTVQEVLRQVGRRLDGLRHGFTAEVSDVALRVDGVVVEDRHGHVRELARALHDSGVRAVRFTPEVRVTDVERLLGVLRDEGAVARAGGLVAALVAAGGSVLEVAEHGWPLRAAEVRHEVTAERMGAPEQSLASMFEAMRRREVQEVDVQALAQAYVEADPAGRRPLGAKLREVAGALRQEGAYEPMARAAEVVATRITDEMGPQERDELYGALMELTTPQVARMLAEELGRAARDEERREELTQVLIRIGSDAAQAVANALAETEDRGARRAYIDALVRFGRLGMPLVEGMLSDSRWFVVRNAVTILGEVGGPQALVHLTGTLGHPDARVRRETVTALTKLGGPDAERLLLGLLDDSDSDVRSAATLAVSVLKVERAVRPLMERLGVESDEDAQVEILRALGRIGDAAAVPAMKKLTSGGLFSRTSLRVRLEALRALGSIGTPHARQVLERAAKDRNSQVREAAQAALRAAEAART